VHSFQTNQDAFVVLMFSFENIKVDNWQIHHFFVPLQAN
jgi:hypothetical protein